MLWNLAYGCCAAQRGLEVINPSVGCAAAHPWQRRCDPIAVAAAGAHRCGHVVAVPEGAGHTSQHDLKRGMSSVVSFSVTHASDRSIGSVFHSGARWCALCAWQKCRKFCEVGCGCRGVPRVGCGACRVDARTAAHRTACVASW